MAHNPIVNQLTLSRTDWRFVVEQGMVGVLFQGQRFLRLLQPGDGLTMNERTSRGGLQVYLMDIQPHDLVWRVELPTKDHGDAFSVTLRLRYQVADPRQIIEERITDTEACVARVCEPLLRRCARDYRLTQFRTAEEALCATVAEADLAGCGLQMLAAPDLTIHLSDQARRRIEEIERNDRRWRTVKTIEHVEEVPSSDPAASFKVSVAVSFRVHKQEDLPSDSIEDAERQLWPRIKRVLRRESRKYHLTQIAEADTAMQDAVDDLLDGEGVSDFGLRVHALQVSTDLDDKARQRYVELATIQHTAVLDKARLEGLKDSTGFYTDLIQKGSWAVLAVAASKGEIPINELYQRLSEKERSQFAMQFEFLKTLRADNAKDERQDYDIAKILMNTVAGQVLGAGNPALGAPTPAKQIAAGDAPAGGEAGA